MTTPFSRPVDTWPVARFSAALLKVASRCNLNCDYCYVYNHADQSWRHQPKLMSDRTVQQFGLRLDEYIADNDLDRFSVIFHGGEPLLYTAEGLVRLATEIRALVRESCHLDFSMQTNGLLLKEPALNTLAQARIAISLSLDGPEHVHDRHRLNHKGASTFKETISALRRLTNYGHDLLSGVIAVIDPSSSPRELLSFFASLNLPRLDLLLPDATHASSPSGRTGDKDSYKRWLEEAFEIWFREYPSLPIRWFDAVLGTRFGLPSPTDIMGFGSVSLIVIETDGSYTDHDVFKIVDNGTAQLGTSVFSSSFSQVARESKIREHGYRLTFDGLASECKTCPAVDACGGGCVMHRAHPKRGMDAPTVYCGEMFGLISTATRLLRDSMAESAAGEPELFTSNPPDLVRRCRKWRRETEHQAEELCRLRGLERGNASAAAVLLSLAHGTALEMPGFHCEPREVGKWLSTVRIQPDDPRLVSPFLDSIRPLSPNSTEVLYAANSLNEVERYLHVLDPQLPIAISTLLTDIIFVESAIPDEGGIFSLSDDKAPNVIYIAPYASGHPISPVDLADSIYHEFLHQILHHFERNGDLLFDRLHPRFPAPWRPGLRPSGGFLHGAFVFTGLSKYWAALADANLRDSERMKARHNAHRTARQAAHGIRCLREFALLTPRGLELVDSLAAELGVSGERMPAPGVLAIASTL